MVRFFCSLVLVMSMPVRAGEVLDYLQGYEWEIPNIALPVVNAEEELIRIANDQSQPGFIRARATSILTLYPSDRVWNFYISSINNPTDDIRRRRVVDALCSAFIDDRSGKLLELLAPLLNAEDAHLRVRVARCLRMMDNDTARSALSIYQVRTAHSWELDAAGW